MRLGPVLLAALCLTAAALLPGMAFAAGDHSEHGAEGPANPMVKQVLLFLAPDGVLAPAAVANATVPAGAATPDGASAPVAWSIKATKHTKLDSSVFVDVFARADAPSLVAGGPDGAAFLVQLIHNGQPVEGAASGQKIGSSLLTPGSEMRIKLFIPQVDLELMPGDDLGVQLSYFGVNVADHESVSYLLGGETGSRIGFRLRMASLAELDLPKEVGSWPVAPLEGFDFQAAAKKDPAAKVATLRAYQFGFNGAPVVVKNNTKVVLHLLVDESLAANPDHSGHGHAGAEPSWDQNVVSALHGFSLGSLDPKLQTVLFDGLVVTMTFQADKPGNHTFLCTVFCGPGHGGMVNRLEVQGEVPAATDANGQPLESTQTNLGPQGETKPTPSPAVPLVAAALALVALAARRRKA